MTNSAGTEYIEGIWSFGRKNANYPFALTLDIVDENINTSGIQGFATAANYFFIACNGDGQIYKTNDSAVYTTTSVYESQIFDLGDASTQKKIEQFTITTPPIPTGGVITAKFKVDNDTSWTTIGTLSTVNEIARDFFNIEATGVDFPTFGEIRFQLTSTGGAELTSFSFISSPLIGSTG